MNYISVRDFNGKLLMMFQVGPGISVKEITDMIDKGLERIVMEASKRIAMEVSI